MSAISFPSFIIALPSPLRSRNRLRQPSNFFLKFPPGGVSPSCAHRYSKQKCLAPCQLKRNFLHHRPYLSPVDHANAAKNPSARALWFGEEFPSTRNNSSSFSRILSAHSLVPKYRTGVKHRRKLVQREMRFSRGGNLLLPRAANGQIDQEKDEGATGYPLSPETGLSELELQERSRREKISMANRGKTPWNKGRKWSDETRRKIKEKTREAMSDPRIREKLRSAGLQQSDDTRARIKERMRVTWLAKKATRSIQDVCIAEWRREISDAARMGQSGESEIVVSRNGRVSFRDASGVLRSESGRRSRAQLLGIKERAEGEAEGKAKKAVEKAEKEIANEIGKAGRGEEAPVAPREATGVRAASTRSEEHRRKIAETIRAKWTDPEYRSKVCSSMQRSSSSALSPPRRRPSSSPSSPTHNRARRSANSDTRKAAARNEVAQASVPERTIPEYSVDSTDPFVRAVMAEEDEMRRGGKGGETEDGESAQIGGERRALPFEGVSFVKKVKIVDRGPKGVIGEKEGETDRSVRDGEAGSRENEGTRERAGEGEEGSREALTERARMLLREAERAAAHLSVLSSSLLSPSSSETSLVLSEANRLLSQAHRDLKIAEGKVGEGGRERDGKRVEALAHKDFRGGKGRGGEERGEVRTNRGEKLFEWDEDRVQGLIKYSENGSRAQNFDEKDALGFERSASLIAVSNGAKVRVGEREDRRIPNDQYQHSSGRESEKGGAERSSQEDSGKIDFSSAPSSPSPFSSFSAPSSSSTSSASPPSESSHSFRPPSVSPPFSLSALHPAARSHRFTSSTSIPSPSPSSLDSSRLRVLSQRFGHLPAELQTSAIESFKNIHEAFIQDIRESRNFGSSRRLVNGRESERLQSYHRLISKGRESRRGDERERELEARREAKREGDESGSSYQPMAESSSARASTSEEEDVLSKLSEIMKIDPKIFKTDFRSQILNAPPVVRVKIEIDSSSLFPSLELAAMARFDFSTLASTGGEEAQIEEGDRALLESARETKREQLTKEMRSRGEGTRDEERSEGVDGSNSRGQ